MTTYYMYTQYGPLYCDDAEYHAADLRKVCYEQNGHLQPDEQTKLYQLLKK